MANKVYDTLIIGGGAAGLSSALTLARLCRTAIVFDSKEYRNQGAKAMHNFLSRDGMHPEEFRATARQQIQESYSSHVTFQRSSITQIAKKQILPDYQGFEAVDTAGETFRGRKVILATGSEDILPTDIEGYRENWPEHIYQCPACDGYERRTHPLGLLSFPDPHHLKFALVLLGLATSSTPTNTLTIFTNGPAPTDPATKTALDTALATGAGSIKLDTRRVIRLVNNGLGPENGITLHFVSGEPVRLGMLFHRPATRSRAEELIKQLGLETTANGEVVVNEQGTMATGVEGCYVAGDAATVMKQVVLAAGDGVKAAAGVVAELVGEQEKAAKAEGV